MVLLVSLASSWTTMGFSLLWFLASLWQLRCLVSSIMMDLAFGPFLSLRAHYPPNPNAPDSVIWTDSPSSKYQVYWDALRIHYRALLIGISFIGSQNISWKNFILRMGVRRSLITKDKFHSWGIPDKLIILHVLFCRHHNESIDK